MFLRVKSFSSDGKDFLSEAVSSRVKQAVSSRVKPCQAVSSRVKQAVSSPFHPCLLDLAAQLAGLIRHRSV